MSVCKCVRCGDCGGSGQVEVRTGSYPEWELESCSTCHGTGISEVCGVCEEEAHDAE